MSFDLTEEPWLPVVRMDGSPGEVGLAALLREAHTIRRIAGETPPMTAALHRLVLAFAHRAYGPPTADGWEELWRAKALPDKLSDRLGRSRQRFDLFDPERPFFQCPAVATVAPSSAAKLVPYRSVGNNTTLFDHTTSRDEVLLTPAEAARWLVTLQAYDPGGLKTPYRRVKSSQAAPANWFGLVLLEGGSFKETLLLNLMVYQADTGKPRNTSPDDRPAWEADPPPPEPDERRPTGWLDLLTWQSRRVWLGRRSTAGDGTVVDRVVITPGTRLKAEPEEHEWMAAYRRPKLKQGRRSKGSKSTESGPVYGPFYPVRLREHRGVWLHSQELLLAPAGGEEWWWQRPMTLDHVAEMAGREAIRGDTVYTLRVFGQQLDSNSSVVHQVLEEAVAAPVAVLKAEYKAAGPIIGRSVELAEQVGGALRQMERDYHRERGGEASTSLDLAYWPHLAKPFDGFLQALAVALDTSTSEEPAAKEWARNVARAARRAAERWAEGSPRVGRDLEIAGAHYGAFLRNLKYHIDRYHNHLIDLIPEESGS